MNNKISKETQEQAIKMAKGTQKKGQTKEQTKLIAQGIEKGIAEYKKQQGKKSRERDKLRKQGLKIQQSNNTEVGQDEANQASTHHYLVKLPWILLLISWVLFLLI